ncbi:hypothetical protein VPH35_116237 [Triticum aestivum]
MVAWWPLRRASALPRRRSASAPRRASPRRRTASAPVARRGSPRRGAAPAPRWALPWRRTASQVTSGSATSAVREKQGSRQLAEDPRRMANALSDTARIAYVTGSIMSSLLFLRGCGRQSCRGLLMFSLFNRYPLIADEVLKEEAWECPKCRNDCNCSKCKKRRGEEPAGPMVHSVKRPKGKCKKRRGEEPAGPTVHSVKRPKGNLRRIESTDALKDEIVIPKGTLVTCVAGVEMQPEDVGAAIQFLEFCRSFGEIFQIRKGQSEKIVKDITGDRQLREVSSVVAELHANLLSVMENGNYKPLKYPKHGDTWIRKLSKYITDSTLHAKDFILDCLSHGLSGYKNLSPSHKLDVLNSLCDEALSSEKLRTRIEAREGVARQKIRAATEKEKELKERQNDMAKTMGGEIAGNEEANNIFCQIKEAKEVKQAAMNELEERGCVLRSTPVMVDKGVAYWKLDGYCDNNTNILRQEFDKEATMKNQDKWFMFSEDEQKVVENHVTTRSQRPWRKDNRV